ncbi:hypothetical protein B0H15DRAFT_26353 [Mycena belliarum]|uniref:Uncharacterized protein n=1 Tax=Mycena belliarum TaxID=1033014 RepID=A0AAD6UJW6_9AGAR|nr:hypothetical protein B0H15DRAFT_26353 [Mycena belliae]
MRKFTEFTVHSVNLVNSVNSYISYRFPFAKAFNKVGTATKLGRHFLFPSFARRGPTIRCPSPPSLRSGGPPSRDISGRHSKASFALSIDINPNPNQCSGITRQIAGVRARCACPNSSKAAHECRQQRRAGQVYLD